MGYKQKAFGDLFEDIFFNVSSRMPGLAITRFPEGCKVLEKNRVIRVKTPCDWILTFGGVTALIDTKTAAGDSFPYSMIVPHQIKEMLKHSHSGAKTGYVIWFRKTDDIIFISSIILSDLINKRGSIKAGQGNSTLLGTSHSFTSKMIFGFN